MTLRVRKKPDRVRSRGAMRHGRSSSVMVTAAARCAFTLAMALLVLAPAATAQVLPSSGPARGHVDLEIRDPDVRTSTHPRNVTVVVSGWIQCDEGAAAPAPVVVHTGIPADRSEPFWVDEPERMVPWESTDHTIGGWSIARELIFQFGTSREPDNMTYGTTGVFQARHDSSDSGCTPNGYEIRGDRDLYTLTVPAKTESMDGGPGLISAGSPAGALLFFAAGALVGVVLTWLAGARMRQRPPH